MLAPMQEPISAEEAALLIPSHSRVFVHSVAAAPQALVHAMAARSSELEAVEVVHVHTEGDAPYAESGMERTFHVNSLFVGTNVRSAVDEGRADFVPIFLSEIPALFRSGRMPIDVALVQVSPPDKHGCCSLGISVDCSLAAVESAKIVIAQINPHMPRTHGDSNVHVSRFAATVLSDEALPEITPGVPSDVEQKIGDHVAELVEDGATLQMGIGAIPNAVLSSLKDHRRLGVHTEIMSDGVVDLVESGAVTCEEKHHYKGKMVAGIVLGSRRLYDFVDDNPMVSVMDIAYVNDTAIIRKQPRMTAINSAIEVDLTGQVVADSIGTYQYSGIGGQMDFVRGAALSEGGKPIIAIPSTTSKGKSRIVGFLNQGAGVVTTRGHVHWVVTEFGSVNLYGLNLRQRAKALIEIAHPDHREQLEREMCERFRC